MLILFGSSVSMTFCPRVVKLQSIEKLTVWYLTVPVARARAAVDGGEVLAAEAGAAAGQPGAVQRAQGGRGIGRKEKIKR